MPFSDADVQHGAIDAAYGARLDAFLATHSVIDAVGAFHAVRRLPYHSSGARTAVSVLDTGRGACTAKHILLRDLLRRIGEDATVEIAAGDFGADMPVAPGMPPALAAMIRDGGVHDFHCYVVTGGPAGEQRLDATWPDALAAHGFAVNADWAGGGDTRLALHPTGVRVRDEDVAAAKARLLAALTPHQAEDRRRFLKLLSEWMAQIG